jgi:hypothetical protein
MALEGVADGLAGVGIPEPQGPIITATDDAFTIRAKGYRPDRIGMTG